MCVYKHGTTHITCNYMVYELAAAIVVVVVGMRARLKTTACFEWLAHRAIKYINTKILFLLRLVTLKLLTSFMRLFVIYPFMYTYVCVCVFDAYLHFIICGEEP